MRRSPFILASLGTIAAALAAGCGGTSPSGAGSTATRTQTVTQLTTVTAPPPASGGGSSAASSNLPRCRTSQLSFTLATNGAAGSIGINGIFTNHSQTACMLYGYPGLGLLRADGSALPSTVVRTPSAVVPAVAERSVVLAPHGQARFYAGYSTAGPRPCPKAAKLEVTPPDAYAHLTIPAATAACGGIIHVSPVFRA